MEAQLSPVSTQFQDLDRLWNVSDPRASEEAYRRLLPQAEQLAGQDRSYLIELHSLIGRAVAAQGKYTEARSALAMADKILQEQQAAYRVSAKIRWLLETGRLCILEKIPSQARPCFVEAWTLAIHSGEDSFAVEVALMMAAIEPQKLQQEWVAKAIRLAEKSPQANAKRWLGTLYSAMGWRFYDARQYDASLEIFQKALSHLNLHGEKREIFVAKWSIGKLLRSMGKLEEALLIQQALLAELGIGGPRDGGLYEELAECLQSLKRFAEAQPYFELAYRELSQDMWVTDNRPAKLRRLKDLGKVK